MGNAGGTGHQNTPGPDSDSYWGRPRWRRCVGRHGGRASTEAPLVDNDSLSTAEGGLALGSSEESRAAGPNRLSGLGGLMQGGVSLAHSGGTSLLHGGASLVHGGASLVHSGSSSLLRRGNDGSSLNAVTEEGDVPELAHNTDEEEKDTKTAKFVKIIVTLVVVIWIIVIILLCFLSYLGILQIVIGVIFSQVIMFLILIAIALPILLCLFPMIKKKAHDFKDYIEEKKVEIPLIILQKIESMLKALLMEMEHRMMEKITQLPQDVVQSFHIGKRKRARTDPEVNP
mmetsp:Transcript_103085/g.204696  ORF Transcript_103085/g.204696 Transcript_103085/m.204696 type:complete len:286 (+) Transcript_103085:75-932(+)